MTDLKDSFTFEGSIDRYNGVTVNLSEEFCSNEEFILKLDGKLALKYYLK